MAYKPAYKCRWFSGKNKFDSFFSKFIIYHSFCINLSFDWLWTVLSVGVHMGRHISEHYCLKQAWIKHTFTPTEGETYSKLQLFLFTSSVSIALYAFVRGKGCVCVEHCPSVGVDGCRWVSKALQLNIRCTTSDESRLARVRCVCVCVHVSIWQTGCLSNILCVPYFEWKMIQNQQIEYSSYMECQL